MRREPPSHQRRVALAGIDVYLVGGIFSVAVDNILTVECVVRFKWFVGSKAVDIDGQLLLMSASQQESNRRFVTDFYWDHVSLAAIPDSDNEHGWLITTISFHAHAWTGHASVTFDRARGLSFR